MCDNPSTGRTAEIARAAEAQVVFEPVNQIGRARNTGAAAAAGRWLLFFDAEPSPLASSWPLPPSGLARTCCWPAPPSRSTTAR